MQTGPTANLLVRAPGQLGTGHHGSGATGRGQRSRVAGVAGRAALSRPQALLLAAAAPQGMAAPRAPGSSPEQVEAAIRHSPSALSSTVDMPSRCHVRQAQAPAQLLADSSRRAGSWEKRGAVGGNAPVGWAQPHCHPRGELGLTVLGQLRGADQRRDLEAVPGRHG